MLALQGSTPLGGTGYRRVISRSVICTIGVAAAHVITAVVVVLTLQDDSYATDKVCRFRRRGACITISVFVGMVVLTRPCRQSRDTSPPEQNGPGSKLVANQILVPWPETEISTREAPAEILLPCLRG